MPELTRTVLTATLLIPTAGPAWLLRDGPVAFTAIQAVSTLRIDRLSPDWRRLDHANLQEHCP